MVGMLSDVGLFRKLNEDYLGYHEDDDFKIYVVADGMGGHNAGEVASKLAVEKTIEYVKNNKSNGKLEEVLISAIQEANLTIYKEAQSDISLNGMGTTITACIIDFKNIFVANVGDSSCYFVEDDKIYKVTKDHSLVQELIDSGSITEEQAINHPNKNIITRALGTNNEVKVDIFSFEKVGIKKVVLCSDGLTNVVTKEEIYDVAHDNDNITASSKLIELSIQKGSRDNISVMIFEGEC
jgi:protein phosphatase